METQERIQISYGIENTRDKGDTGEDTGNGKNETRKITETQRTMKLL